MTCIQAQRGTHTDKHGNFTMDFCGRRFERAEFIQAAMNICQKYLALQKKKTFLCVLSARSHVHHMCVCVFFFFVSSTQLSVRFYYLWYIQWRFCALTFVSQWNDRICDWIGGTPPCAEYNQLQKKCAARQKKCC